jgi:hypothetical protein
LPEIVDQLPKILPADAAASVPGDNFKQFSVERIHIVLLLYSDGLSLGEAEGDSLGDSEGDAEAIFWVAFSRSLI